MADCKTCDIPDVNCYEQCKEESTQESDCKDCMGASFNDCFECKTWLGNDRPLEDWRLP